MSRRIELTERVLQSIREHILFHYPREACGILIGNETNRIEEIRFAENTEIPEEAESGYEMDPFLVYRVERELPDDQRICGFYHSHPDKPAVPSKKDDQYMIPQLIYLILSTDGDTCNEIRAYYKQRVEAESHKEVEVDLL